MYGLKQWATFVGVDRDVPAIIGDGHALGTSLGAITDEAIRRLFKLRGVPDNTEYIRDIAPAMARFDLGGGRGFGVLLKETDRGVTVVLPGGTEIFRKFKRDNVVIYPDGVIFKN